MALLKLQQSWAKSGCRPRGHRCAACHGGYLAGAAAQDDVEHAPSPLQPPQSSQQLRHKTNCDFYNNGSTGTVCQRIYCVHFCRNCVNMKNLVSPRNRHVGLLIESSRAYGRGLLRGIARYIRTHRHWTVSVQVRGTEDPPPPWLKNWKGDGFLVRVHDRDMERAILRSGLPALDLRGDLGSRIPLFRSNDQAPHAWRSSISLNAAFGVSPIVATAAPPIPNDACSFSALLRDAGLDCHTYQSPRPLGDTGLSLREQQARLFETELFHWLRQLPRPIGVMASNDIAGSRSQRLPRAGHRRPRGGRRPRRRQRRAALRALQPAPSSVDPDTERIGYRAAELLDRMMSGSTAPPPETLLEPSGVVGASPPTCWPSRTPTSPPPSASSGSTPARESTSAT